ncbi:MULTISPECIES: hypothetical protein [unclassified Janthinobacterium]|uniref:hypothetical protein n=1 Tax=unclassified Janthinobacterium TaxID=2610881 RepID=UPI0016128FD7|nr:MULTISPECIES: hypothetical protein [unclassified Janthinobacterium]MBB5369871.1 hypothetical protein [Janthinobacterium sp. K2C7]MBB5382677.1 hypothetical protein [Janthinobacterium sp. K2Li3]MBB5384662.1 hypothetical protein [Janthinobacterium sp. K2E3]
MNNPKKNSYPRTPSEEIQIKYAIDFIEELSWLFESKKKLNFPIVSELLRKRLLPTPRVADSSAAYVSPNPNIHYLIGILPRLFQDENLFLKNEEIAEFAKEVLGIEISRVEKRSKYELIGLIVCQTNELNDEKLDEMVRSLSHIAGNNDKLNLMANEKASTGFSWNEAIRKLAVENDS